MRELADLIDDRLRSAGTPERAEHERRYLKSELEHYGTTVPAIRKVTRECCRAAGGLDRDRVVGLVRELWRFPVHERRMAAVEVLTGHSGVLDAGDLPLVEGLVRDSDTWALVDALAVHVAGDIVERAPEGAGRVLDRWAVDEDFWLRRSAMLALLPGLRRAEGDFARFARYADRMLDEREFFIRKAIGWVLRETSKRRPGLVDEWLAPRTARASGVTMREAVKYLPAERAAELMAAYRDGRPVA